MQTDGLEVVKGRKYEFAPTVQSAENSNFLWTLRRPGAAEAEPVGQDAAEEGQQDIPDPLCKSALDWHPRRTPVMRPADAPQSRLSIMPRMAMENAGVTSAPMVFRFSAPNSRRIFGNQCFGDFPNHSDIQLHENGKRSW